jgi:hypothetical protein
MKEEANNTKSSISRQIRIRIQQWKSRVKDFHGDPHSSAASLSACFWPSQLILLPVKYIQRFVAERNCFTRTSVKAGRRHKSRRSRVQRFRGSRLHSCPWTAFGMRIYKKSVSFVRPNLKFATQLAIILENKHF